MEKKWSLKKQPPVNIISKISSELNISGLLAALFYQRGIDQFDEAKNFLNPKIEDLHNPFLMKDMAQAVERINSAISKNEKILIYGDYDVDGTTSVAMVYTFFKSQGLKVDFYIPDRYTEGYGVSFKGVDFAVANDFKLIIALDCGIRAVDQIDYARKNNIDFIVCDHHEPGDFLPNGILLNPKQKECNYPFKELSGCGVGFKLLQACTKNNNWNEAELHELLDFVAVSIGADIVPVTGENRTLCYLGMVLLNSNPRKSFELLLKNAKKSFPINLTDVVFAIAPRINAAGRLRSGREAVQLMISDDENQILKLANEIENDNKQRRQLDQEITQEALALISQAEKHKNSKTTVVFQSHWHKGVVGIVASRLIEKHYKPTIVLTESNGIATGSARTVQDFDIYAALLKCEHLLDQFGGHKHAAGVNLQLDKVDEFIDYFEMIVQESISADNLLPELNIDLEINFQDLFDPSNANRTIPKILKQLERFEPFGPGNMKPVFLVKNCFCLSAKVLKETHLKVLLTQPPSNFSLDGIGFNLGNKISLLSSGKPIDVAFTIESNTWNGKTSLQLNIKDLRESF
jgi:single-stranded-DNA-specific exonuclease